MRGIFGKLWRTRGREKPRTVLGALAHDTRGNVLAIMAAALIPFCGMVGGGIDLSRMYLTKTRLQHACDAGALAGRKQMGAGVWTANSNAANAAAVQFFNANFTSTGMYGGNAPTVAFSENAGKVTGTASAVLPMTLMRVLGFTQETLAVTCDADMRLPNTDIMFVLDNTGSMGQKAVPTDTDTKIESLRTSVKCFYEIVARLDTDATCTTGTPSGGTGNQVQIRFGFVPYTTNVNVGRLLNTGWMADSWKYQSRAPRWWIRQGTPVAVPYPVSATNVPQSSCNNATAQAVGAPYFSITDNLSNNGTTKTNTTVTTNVTSWLPIAGGTCSGIQTRTTTIYTLQENVQGGPNDQFIEWHYGQITHNISGLKSGTSWNNSFSLPLGTNGAARTIGWNGCIEERPTVAQSSYSPIPATAYDLNIDLVPTSGNANSLWGPALNDTVYLRGATSNYSQMTTPDAYTTNEYINGGSNYCPTAAKKLQSWPAASDFDSYVDSLQPNGNTYHDIGMLWGARLMSPTGIFASENATTPQGGSIDRHMIFMTDGDAVSSPCDYTAYGLLWYDRRTTTDVGAATDCANERQQLDDQVNARLTALCTAVKNKNITLWVISFGSGSNATTEQRLSDCATPGRYFTARDSATLQATFASIANQISQLRLVK